MVIIYNMYLYMHLKNIIPLVEYVFDGKLKLMKKSSPSKNWHNMYLLLLHYLNTNQKLRLAINLYIFLPMVTKVGLVTGMFSIC